jgi:outer membrane receptor protein involved in Fe transport
MFTYSGSNTQPTISQIQPVRDNTNPEVVMVGNPNLDASFRNTFSSSYTSINQLSGELFALSGNYSFTTNSIISNSTINTTTGKTTTQYVNLLNASPYNYNINTQLNPKIFGVRFDFLLSTNGNATYAYSDNQLSKTINSTYTGNITYRKNVAKKYNIQLGAGPNYTFSSNSLQSTANYNYPGLNSTATATVYLPGKFQLTTELRYRYQGGISNQPAVYNKLWNAGINKTFLKDDNLMLSLTGTNLLNQDQNTRSVNALGFTQTSVNTIKRFFMLTVTWDFTKFGTIPVKN